MSGNYQYTKRMETLFRSRTSELRTFYCREDFVRALKGYKRAGRDKEKFCMDDLAAMCSARGIGLQELLKDKSVLKTVPTRADLQERLMEILYELYTAVPSSASYMERTVRRLAPEYEADSVRTAILKRFVLGAGPDWGAFRTTAVLDWAVERMSPEEKWAYTWAVGAKKLKMAVDRLDDSIFSREHMVTELTAQELMELIDRRLALLSTRIRVTDSTGRACMFGGLVLSGGTREQMLEYCAARGAACEPGCGDGVILKRAIEICGGDQPGFLPALEKDFSALMKRTWYKTQKGKLDTADSLFKTDRKDARKKKGGDWALLRLCDDLARGRFKTNGGQTRVYLYYFAIMFGMTIVLRETDVYDENTDMVKNLLEDYYSDNLIRYLDDAYDNPQFASTLEKEPGGEGINFKNFAEVIYIYYLYRRDLKLTPGERIDQAERMIDKCMRKASPAGPGEAPDPKEHTELYQQKFLDHIIGADERQLAGRILANYHIAGSGGSRIQVAAERNTAYDIAQETMEDLEASGVYEVYLDLDCGSNQESRDRVEKLMDEAKSLQGMMIDWKLAPLLRERYSADKGFLRVIDNLDERIRTEFEWIGVRKKGFLSSLLHALYHNTEEGKRIRLEKLKTLLQEVDPLVDGSMVLGGAEILAAMGFDVHRESVRGESCLCLGARVYRDDKLNAVIDRIKNKYYYHVNEDAVKALFSQLLEEKQYFDRRVTRTTLIAIYTSFYVTLLQDTRGIDSLPDLYDDFTASINPVLEEARFQPLNEKNILDMYVLLSLYLYLIENGK